MKTLIQTRATGELQSIVLATVIGLGLLFVAGFSHAQTTHDVAHDTRHAMAFPCH